MASTTEKQKQSLYFPEDMLREIMKESVRLDRSLSWTVQQAWRVARGEVHKLPAFDSGRSPERARPAPLEARPADLEHREPSAQVREFLKGKFEFQQGNEAP